ncbi:MAG: bifunctional nuclease family protein [candidate division Zixibacteria bacterium]|jgi:bifunctional DNase/RNase|nr:bifunctional nuclease family protein [candidate division Zixibacteria bacterium]
MQKAKINGLALDITTNSPVIILAPESGQENRILPIWIGHYEAWAIAMELSGVASKRPLTHDLIRTCVENMGGKVTKVEVTELVNQTFYAKIYIQNNGKVMEIDARPSDSIALALKTSAPIFVNEELFQMKRSDGITQDLSDPESLKDRLRRIPPEEFGKYSL